MQCKHTIFLSLTVLLLLLAGLFALPGTQLYFQANHLRYLTNANQFNEALLEYAQLAQVQPAIATRLPDFETSVTQRAMNYYAGTRLPETSVERQDYSELMETLLARPALAPLARQMDLRVKFLRDGATTPTLEAARAILDHDGFDMDALWWAVISGDPVRSPLDVPAELLRWRLAVEDIFIDPQGADPLTAGRLSYLKGLLALAGRNWAEAAYLFEQYRRLAPAELPRTPGQALAQGLALLRSGRGEAAIAMLEPYTHREKPTPQALGLLAEAFLSARSYPWAAQAISEIRRENIRDREDGILLAVFVDLSNEADPFAALCARLSEPSPYTGNTRLWNWLATIADDETRRQAVDRAALALASRGDLAPEDGGLLLEYALDRPGDDLARLVIDGMRSPTLRAVFLRILQWYPQRSQPQAATLPLGVESLGLLLTHSTTRRIELDLPAGAEAIVLHVKGYPGQEVWPILHLDLGDLGQQTWYVTDRSRSGRPLVFVLPHPLEINRRVEAAISMLNGEPGGREDRNIVITDMSVF